MNVDEKNLVMPDYKHCILNTVTSILKYYNVETKHNSSKLLDSKLEKRYKNVILLILDGMGEHILNNISPNGFLNRNKIDVITSVYPSTTTAALTTYYAGKPPYETGWIAWSQYFKEYGRAVDMLKHRESYKGESLEDARMNVFENIVNYKTIFDQIEEASPNTNVFEVMPEYSERRAKNSIKANDIDEVIDSLKILTSLPNDNFIMAYCDNPDSILHKYGTDSIEAKDYLLETEEKIKRFSEELEENSIIIISADHGHKNIEKAYTLLDYPEILECLITPPSLESRTVAFWVKEEMKDAFVERFNSHFKNEFWLMSREEFLSKNLLGFGEKHPKTDDFIGNYIALSTSSSIIRLETFLAEGKKVKKSTHCGITKEEMEVPVIVLEK
ncbi:MAG: alkaline phosphatase family protein [Clostridia bacterium]|nr:alkaline phosphatase family protein [Clostridia bacterium]